MATQSLKAELLKGQAGVRSSVRRRYGLGQDTVLTCPITSQFTRTNASQSFVNAGSLSV